MANNRNVEELKSILERIDTQISNCDNKAIAVLGCLGVMLGIFLATDFIGKVLSLILYFIKSKSVIHFIWLVLTGISIIVIVLGAVCLFSALLSRINPKVFKNTVGEVDSLVFWGSIASYANYNDYLKKIEKVDENALKKDYISQIYICSKICKIKNDYYNKGLKKTGIGIVLYGILIVIGIYVRQRGV